MKIDSEHLEILSAIVEKGGLTEAADSLGKSQPSVSRSMALLESRIGLTLFEPGRRPLRPTELCQALARQGDKIREANRNAGQLVQRYRQGHAGRLRIGGSPVFLDGVIAGMIAEFQVRHPEVQIEQSYGYAAALTAGLRSGALDLAILPMPPLEIAPDLEFSPAVPGRNVVACRQGHPLTRQKAITLQDIAPYPWIAPPQNSPLYRDLQNALQSIGRADFHVSFSGGGLASITSVLAGSDALTVLPYSVVFLARRSIPLDVLPLKIDHPDRHLGLLTARGQERGPAARLLHSYILGELRRLHARMEHEQQVTRRRG